jgi:hypothetical protein
MRITRARRFRSATGGRSSIRYGHGADPIPPPGADFAADSLPDSQIVTPVDMVSPLARMWSSVSRSAGTPGDASPQCGWAGCRRHDGAGNHSADTRCLHGLETDRGGMSYQDSDSRHHLAAPSYSSLARMTAQVRAQPHTSRRERPQTSAQAGLFAPVRAPGYLHDVIVRRGPAPAHDHAGPVRGHIRADARTFAPVRAPGYLHDVRAHAHASPVPALTSGHVYMQIVHTRPHM